MNIMPDEILKQPFFVNNNSEKNVNWYYWWWKWIENEKVKEKKIIILRHEM